MLEVGKLYSCSVYFLSLFPDKEAAAEAAAESATATAAAAALTRAAAVESVAIAALATAEAATRAAAYAAYWSRELGKPVSYCDLKTVLLVLSVLSKYIEVLAGDKRGWIINEDWLNIGEIR